MFVTYVSHKLCYNNLILIERIFNMKILIYFLLLSVTTFSHPHVFLEAQVKLDIQDNTLKGIHYTVNLDEMNSMLLSMRYEVNKDGLLTIDGKVLTPETYPVDETELNVYKIRYNDQNIEDITVQLKKVYMEDIYFTYEFYIPLDIKTHSGDKLNVSIYDNEYYLDYYYDEYSINMLDGSKMPNFSLIQNKKIKFYMDLMNPIEYEVIF